uniref:Uncharacterized protein n=1 Tax=Octopus bimaculoides TaxID=37653 RepID=A0A0L8GKG4_OCTBM
MTCHRELLDKKPVHRLRVNSDAVSMQIHYWRLSWTAPLSNARRCEKEGERKSLWTTGHHGGVVSNVIHVTRGY